MKFNKVLNIILTILIITIVLLCVFIGFNLHRERAQNIESYSSHSSSKSIKNKETSSDSSLETSGSSNTSTNVDTDDFNSDSENLDSNQVQSSSDTQQVTQTNDSLETIDPANVPANAQIIINGPEFYYRVCAAFGLVPNTIQDVESFYSQLQQNGNTFTYQGHTFKTQLLKDRHEKR